MACNGHNHSPHCGCSFGGQAATSRPALSAPRAILLGDLAPPRWEPKGLAHEPRACKKCGLPVCFVRAPNGGSYTATADGTYLKHRCPRRVPADPLRLRRAAWRKDCFTATMKAKRRVGGRQRLEVTGLAEGPPFVVEVLDDLVIDPKTPAMCRWSKTDAGVLEITYLNHESGDLSGTIVRARRVGSLKCATL